MTVLSAIENPHSSSQSIAGQGRLQILDALRAVAVIAVVIFHTFPSALPGGFMGVDIFFFISGFIIWLKYGEKLLSKQVNFKHFFHFRVRRLLPAYAVFIVGTTALALIVLPPNLLIEYSNVLIANAFYAQNFALFAQGDYFFAAETKPLLHTWSLAIEEQYYLIFPIFVILARIARPIKFFLLIAMLFGSLALGALISDISARMTFYMLPFRIWEFAAGMALAMAFGRFNALKFPNVIANLVGYCGLIAMLFSFLLFDSKAPFPGWQSLLAIGGAAMVCTVQLRLTGPSWLVLKNRIVQHFGRISYSWYLWHWPIICFFFVSQGHEPNYYQAAVLLVIGYALGAASYAFVESSSYINRVLKTPKTAFLCLISFTICTILAGTFLIRSNGAIFRYPLNERPFVFAQNDKVSERCRFIDRLKAPKSSVCTRVQGASGPRVLLVGDSHSNMIRPQLMDMARASDSTLLVSTNICRPRTEGKDFCRGNDIAKLLKDADRLSVDKILLAARWPEDFTLEDFNYILEQFASAKAQIYVLKSFPEGEKYYPSYENRTVDEMLDGSVVQYADRNMDAYNSMFGDQIKALEVIGSQNDQVTILDPVNVLCPQDKCIFSINGKPLYKDDNHLNSAGSAAIQPVLSELFEH